MKNVINKILCFIINIMIGGIAFFSFLLFYAFALDPYENDHDLQTGIMFLLISLTIIVFPNLRFFFCNKFNIKELLIYQILPMVLGVILYIIFISFFR